MQAISIKEEKGIKERFNFLTMHIGFRKDKIKISPRLTIESIEKLNTMSPLYNMSATGLLEFMINDYFYVFYMKKPMVLSTDMKKIIKEKPKKIFTYSVRVDTYNNLKKMCEESSISQNKYIEMIIRTYKTAI